MWPLLSISTVYSLAQTLITPASSTVLWPHCLPYGLVRLNFLNMADSFSQPFKDSCLLTQWRPDFLPRYPVTSMIWSNLSVPFSSHPVQSCLCIVPQTALSLSLPLSFLCGIATTLAPRDPSLGFKDWLMWTFTDHSTPSCSLPSLNFHRTFWQCLACLSFLPFFFF